MDPVIIGIAGGTGAGKTTVIRHISRQIGKKNIVVLEHDSYYRDLTHLSPEERANQNFDHPSALETELMIQHLKALKEGREVEVPVYDFTHHVRKEETRQVKPKKLILVDGILIFSEQDLREHMDIKIFVDTDDDVRLMRRIRRDIVERDRSLEGVLNQYEKYVRPMHLEFVEPSKRYADIIIPRGGENDVALEMVQALIAERISDE
ncbi:uridine kinase [Aliifodinibius sp. S!AR15-10]|uniref:uridine kinase n=1 Tax=Aliifodinibius sp. S!AR15-10 TaxID=2950437 RepID=UPI00285A83D6|nr:uridine kinase [Aliifodinibius sp. S!AR15-10]MDR8392176.1 uridine kinase [Aliifodinibius sp. S!AR15-10]